MITRLRSWIGTLPAPVRHSILLISGGVLAPWLLTSVIPALRGEVAWGTVIGALVMALEAFLTPLIQSYGLGKVGK